MTTETQLKQYAAQIAEAVQSREAHLERGILDLETKLAQARSARDAAGSAAQRLADFEVQFRGNYQCPSCWIENKTRSNLSPVPSNTQDDLFRCRTCRNEFVIKF